MALILPQSGTSHQRLWLLSGTGEGPKLAGALIERGWQLRVSVVSAAAARAYRLARVHGGAVERNRP